MFEEYLNKFVKVLPQGAGVGHHPTEDRSIREGDILYISNVGNTLLSYMYREITQEIQPDMVEILENNKYIGKNVRYIGPKNFAFRPNGFEPLCVGDVVKIIICDTSWVGYACSSECEAFGKGFNAFMPKYAELVTLKADVCMCKSLLFGHEFGCPMFKSY
ncbi:MAG: hypothetical protein KGI50_07185 [Patescibacteria group bacterium]|nr:hypothetical protein [Patescibacteria group bacterium]MDE2439312.1 hypothetical protein [Patescibacteria group bacterium]